MTPTIAVVIPCRNERRTIGALFEALEAQVMKADEVIVADDGSTDGTRDVIDAWKTRGVFPSLRVVPAPGRGAGAAMNAGIAAATADIIVRLDGHCRPQPDYIARSVETLALPGAAVAGGIWKIEPGGSSLAARGIAAVLSHRLGSGGAAYRSVAAGPPRDVDTVPFGTFRRDLWERLGGFDESLLRNQDYDFNYRAGRTSGRVILNPAIVCTYQARATFASLARQYYDYGFWKVVMLRKFPESVRLRQVLPMLLIPLLAGGALWFAVAPSTAAVLVMAAYLALDAGGGIQGAVRAGDLRLAPFGAAALIVLQMAWSVGAWMSLLGLRVRY